MRPWVRKRTRLILFVPRDVNETLGEEDDTVNSICTFEMSMRPWVMKRTRLREHT